MTHEPHWSLDRDPPRDEALGRLLRSADGPARNDMDWERLHGAIMRAAGISAGPVPAVASREWWRVLVQWRRLAAAASVAAILAAGALEWRGESSTQTRELRDAAPESVALARVVAAFPDDDVLSSLLQTAGNDELASWEGQ
ncbi:MAG: hypothetical protein ACJ8DC_08890 [Gemmatimonadales bacterium]